MLAVTAFFHIPYIKTWQTCIIVDIAFIKVFHFENCSYRTSGTAYTFHVHMRLTPESCFLGGEGSGTCSKQTVMNTVAQHFAGVNIVKFLWENIQIHQGSKYAE